MPQLQQIDTFLSQVVWLVLAFAVLFVVLRTIALPKIQATLEARRDRIEGDLDRAQTLRRDAEHVLAEYEAAMAEGRGRAQSVIRDAVEDGKAQAAAAQAALAARLADDIAGAEARIAAARDEAVGSIREVAVDVVQAAAQRLIGGRIARKSAADAVDAVADR